MASKTEICNLALSHLGISKDIANVDTEQSQEAKACRRFYDLARQTTLKDFNWPFATKFLALGLIEENPTDEWRYSYRYPNDCLYARRILSGFRDDTENTRIQYKVGQDDAGLLFYTDKESATLEYTVDIEDVSYFSSDFKMALSYRLAHYIAARITAGDPFNLADKSFAKYKMEITNAAANALNEDKSSLPFVTESIQARD